MEERLTRGEFSAIYWIYNIASSWKTAQKDLEKRFAMIDGGTERVQKIVDQMWDVMRDINKTIPDEQKKRIAGTMGDMEMRLMPKLTPAKTSVIMTKEQGKMLFDIAQERCAECVLDGEEAKGCKLYRLLEAVIPLDEYGNGMLCPYSKLHGEWRD